MICDHPITVLVGHAGVGKTNVALHLALSLARSGHTTTAADLDTVNPYFRLSDYRDLLVEAGVRVVEPVFARSTLDTPSLTGELDAVVARIAANPDERLVIDVGGDDDGATTIGRFAQRLRDAGAQVLYVVSAMRALTPTPEEAAAMLPEIERHAHLQATGVLNATNLSTETTPQIVASGRAFAQECARMLDLPLVATAIPEVTLAHLAEGQSLEAALGVEGMCHEEFTVLPKYVGIPWE